MIEDKNDDEDGFEHFTPILLLIMQCSLGIYLGRLAHIAICKKYYCTNNETASLYKSLCVKQDEILDQNSLTTNIPSTQP